MLHLQPFGELADGRPVAPGKAAHMQQQQVLQRCQARAAGRTLAEMQEAPQLVAELGEGFVLRLVERRGGFGHRWRRGRKGAEKSGEVAAPGRVVCSAAKYITT